MMRAITITVLVGMLFGFLGLFTYLVIKESQEGTWRE